MPRIRTIKPEFWSDEKLSTLDPITRLVFLGLICMADDAGRLVDNVKLLDGMIFPSTGDTCRESLATLSRLGRIIRYRSASGQDLLQVAKWKDHQKVDKPSKYVLPGPTSHAVAQAAAKSSDTGGVATPSRDTPGDTREDLARLSRSDLGPTTSDLGPSTNDLGPAEADLGSESAPESRPRIPLPPDAIAFGKRFYTGAARDRVRDVKRQLRATLNGGAEVKKGVRVFAGSPERLAAKCREVMAEGVKNPDRAIVVLLRKLGDVSDDSPTERAAADLKRQERADDVDTAQRLADAEAWLASNPDELPAIETRIDAAIAESKLGPRDPLYASTRRILRRSALLTAFANAGEHTPQPAGTP